MYDSMTHPVLLAISCSTQALSSLAHLLHFTLYTAKLYPGLPTLILQPVLSTIGPKASKIKFGEARGYLPLESRKGILVVWNLHRIQALVPPSSSSPADTGHCSCLHALSLLGAWSPTLWARRDLISCPLGPVERGFQGQGPFFQKRSRDPGLVFFLPFRVYPLGQVGRGGEGSRWCYDVALDIE